MFSTKEFFAHITKEGLARPNRFFVIINLPAGISDPNIAKTLSLMCMQTELPSKTINVSETKYNGNIKKMAMSKLYYQQQFVFAVSSKMYEKEIIDAWMDLIIGDTHELSYYDDYNTEIEVYQLDMKDKPVHAVKFNGCFPVVVNPLTVSNSDQNTTHQLMVQFAYESWETILSSSNLTPNKSSDSNAQTVLTNKGKKSAGFVDNNSSIDIQSEHSELMNIKKGLSEEASKYIDKLSSTIATVTKENAGQIASDIELFKNNKVLSKITEKETIDRVVDKVTSKLSSKASSNISKFLSKLF